MITQTDSLLGMNISYKPLPGSKKIYKKGELFKNIKVPFRQIELSPSVDQSTQEKITNDPIEVYDTSGLYTDPKASIDITQGLPEQRRSWILNRDDIEQLDQATSAYRFKRIHDEELNNKRFPIIKKPLRAKSGQM